MRITVTVDDDLFGKAQAITGLPSKSAVVREALRSLVAREAARRLARLGGTAPQLKPIRRRRSAR